MSMAKFEMLAKRVDLFKGLSAEDVAKIFSRGMTSQAKRGDILFYKDTTGNQMYVILGGKISLYDGKKHLTDLGAGEMFGEMALISSEPRSATAVAAEDSLLFVLSETTFTKLLTKRVAVSILLNIVGTLSRRIRETNRMLKELKELQEN